MRIFVYILFCITSAIYHVISGQWRFQNSKLIYYTKGLYCALTVSSLTTPHWTLSTKSRKGDKSIREHSFFRRGRGGVAGGIPMSMNVKSTSPPFVFFLKRCDPPLVSSKIYSNPSLCCVKFMLALPFWAGKKLMTLP